jgi:DNA-binding response OmpR family regulator
LILICEDEPLIAIDIADTFAEAGARVVRTRTLKDGLLAVEDGALSAAVVDHALEDGDSTQLCARRKERNIPFVTYSGYSEVDGVCATGVHVRKPVEPQVLVTTIEGLLRSRPISN